MGLVVRLAGCHAVGRVSAVWCLCLWCGAVACCVALLVCCAWCCVSGAVVLSGVGLFSGLVFSVGRSYKVYTRKRRVHTKMARLPTLHIHTISINLMTTS